MTSSIFSEVGLSRDDYMKLRRPGPTQFGPGFFDQPGGDPLVGLNYMTDYRHEEEKGSQKLREAVTGKDPRNFVMTQRGADYVTAFADKTALLLSTRNLQQHPPKWGDPLTPWGRATSYVRNFTDNVAYTRGINRSQFWSDKVPDLRRKAKEAGITPLPKTRKLLEDALIEHMIANTPERGHLWPGWFSDGEHLVLRADDGVTKQILDRLIAAAQRGTLGIGDRSGPFATGLFFYDAAEETAELVRDREAAFDWHDARMAELEPVKDELEADGYPMFFLGIPERTADGHVRYFMNSGAGGKLAKSVSGWFTLEQLKDRSFVTVAEERRAG